LAIAIKGADGVFLFTMVNAGGDFISLN